MSDFSKWRSPARFKAAIDPIGKLFPITYVNGWDDPSIAAYQAPQPTPEYCLLHHTGIGHTWDVANTANGDHISLDWLLQPIPPSKTRGIHVLVGRTGHVYVVTALPCWHAGAGGDGNGTWHKGDGPNVPNDLLNAYSYGLEMESTGINGAIPNVPDNGIGYTEPQLHASFLVESAYLQLISEQAGHTVSDERLVEHEDWSSRKGGDTQLTHAEVQSRIHAARIEYAALVSGKTAPIAPQGDSMFIVRPNGWVYLLTNGHVYGVSNATWQQVKSSTVPQVHVDDAAFTRIATQFPVVPNSSI